MGTYEGTQAFLEGMKPVVFDTFGQFPCIWIRIPYTDPVPDSG
jgi:hypothetical protein